MATIEEAEKWIGNHTRDGLIMCPACGRIPDLYFDPCTNGFIMVCPDCGDEGDPGDDIESAVANWNAGIDAEYVREQHEAMED